MKSCGLRPMAKRRNGKMPNFSGLQSRALIQALGQFCGLRPMADQMIGNEMPVFSGIRRMALIQAVANRAAFGHWRTEEM
jgi:hypothetical protein